MPDSRSPAEGILLWAGHVFFWVLILTCWVFFRERLLAFDTAYYTFHLLTFEEFFIKHDRYISYLTQWVPLLLTQGDAPLHLIMRAYSTSFYLWFYLLFILISHGFRHVAGGTFLVFSICLGMRYKFFASISEITFAIVLAAVLVIWVAHRSPKVQFKLLDWVTVALLLAGIFGAHPVVVYPIMTFLVFDMLYRGTWNNLRSWVMPTFILLVFSLKFFLVQGDSYESGKMDILFQPEAIRNIFQNQQDYYVFTALREYVREEYLPALLIFMGLVGWLFYQRKIGAAIFILLATAGWTFLNIITYAYLRGPVYIMLDGYLAVFGLIWGTPMYFFLRAHQSSVRWTWLFVVLIAFSTYRMLDKQRFYHQRLRYIEQTLAMNPGPAKLLVPLWRYEWDNMWYPYEIAHESLMLTALKGKKHCRTIFVNADIPNDSDKLQTTGFLQFTSATPLSKINESRFFYLPDSAYYRTESVAWKE